jgi:hypothetical protein
MSNVSLDYICSFKYTPSVLFFPVVVVQVQMLFLVVIHNLVWNNSSIFAPALFIGLLRPPCHFILIADEQGLPQEMRVAGVPQRREESDLLPYLLPPVVLRGPLITVSTNGLGDGGQAPGAAFGRGGGPRPVLLIVGIGGPPLPLAYPLLPGGLLTTAFASIQPCESRTLLSPHRFPVKDLIFNWC